MANRPIIGNGTVGGVAKSLSGGYVNVGGVWKPIVETYDNVGGVWKPAWEKVFVWKKYNTVSVRKDGWTWGASGRVTGTRTRYMSLMGISNQDKLTATYGLETLISLKLNDTSYFEKYMNGSSDTVTVEYLYGVLTGTGIDYGDSIILPKIVRLGNTWNGFPSGYNANDFMYYMTGVSLSASTYTVTFNVPVYSPTYSYSQGAYIGAVTAETENAYPTNGRHTDGYWYVFQG